MSCIGVILFLLLSECIFHDGGDGGGCASGDYDSGRGRFLGRGLRVLVSLLSRALSSPVSSHLVAPCLPAATVR